MPNSSLHAIHDAVHGSIDVAKLGGQRFQDAVNEIIRSPAFRRLKRIKQLGFVSANHISAGHDRYAHSLGSMYMMWRLLNRLQEGGQLRRPGCDILNDLRGAFPDLFEALDDRLAAATLAEHLMLAALIQDIGELPYNLALARLSASEGLRTSVRAHAPVDIGQLEPKIIFAMEWLRRSENEGCVQGYDVDFLTVLLAGCGPEAPPGLRAVRHMLDGAIDADRLDYVHRDAFHVLGIRHDANGLIESLAYYDQDGPVFDNAGPIADFLALRATLWSTVYLSPANRFRVTLLRAVMTELARPNALKSPFAPLAARGLEYGDFLHLDDANVDAVITSARAGEIDIPSGGKAEHALKVLNDAGQRYQFHWLPEPKANGAPVDEGPTELPTELFVDTYYDYQRHRLYDANSIRVDIDAYRYMGQVVGLERCSGPFNHLLADRASGLPMPGCIAVFRPVTARGGGWPRLEQGLRSGSLYYRLRREGLIDLQPVRGDTRDREDFIGPDIFISFEFADIETVREIALGLERRRCRYFCLQDAFDGMGATTLENSRQAVREAGTVLLIYSRSYAAKFAAGMNGGNLNGEVMEMVVRVANDGLKVIPVTLEEYDASMAEALPWRFLGYNDGASPMVGAALEGAMPSRVDRALDEVLKRLGRRTGNRS